MAACGRRAIHPQPEGRGFPRFPVKRERENHENCHCGKKEFILSALATLDPRTRTLHLRIKARDQGMPHRLDGGWNLFGALVPEGAAPPSHRLVAVREYASMESGAEVVFLPENEEENDLLFGTAYVQTGEAEIAYLIVPREQSLRTQTLARLTV